MKRLNSSGFSLVELLILGPILMVTIVMTMSFLFGQYGQLTQQGALINLRTDAQTITFSMQDDVFFAANFAQTKNANLDDTYAPSGGWDYDTDPQTLIISTPALTDDHRSDDREPVYINTLGCDPGTVDQNDLLFNNIIYFVEGTTLYKRVLSAPASMSTCGTSHLDQTCPAANATESCQADVVMTDKLHEFNITYYTADNTVTTDPELAEKIVVDIELTDVAYAEDIYASSSVTMKRLNE